MVDLNQMLNCSDMNPDMESLLYQVRLLLLYQTESEKNMKNVLFKQFSHLSPVVDTKGAPRVASLQIFDRKNTICSNLDTVLDSRRKIIHEKKIYEENLATLFF
jgi:hypothetical protein